MRFSNFSAPVAIVPCSAQTRIPTIGTHIGSLAARSSLTSNRQRLSLLGMKSLL